MNTIINFTALVDEFKFKLNRELDEQELHFLRWVESQHVDENQCKERANS